MKKSQIRNPHVLFSALVKNVVFMLLMLVSVNTAFSHILYSNQINKDLFSNISVKTMPDSLPYLGQPRPDTIPLRFGPSYLLSNGIWTWHGSPKFSPDGKEMFFVKYHHNLSSGEAKIYVMNDINGVWTLPAPPGFESDSIDNSPVYSEDGDTLYFSSRRNGSMRIYYVTRTSGDWSQPQLLNMAYQSLPGILGWDFSITRNSTIYFTLVHPVDGVDIYRSNLTNGQYSQFEKLPMQINTSYQEATPFIHPDEEYILFSSNRPGVYGLHDIYISFRNSDGSWNEAQNMGSPINGTHEEAFPWVTFDGKYMFFNSAKTGDLGYNAYWIDTKVFDKFKPPIGIIKEGKTIPEDFYLYQNYPNPFNPSTVIKYDLPVTEFVSLKIYDAIGREIASLVNNRQEAGVHEVVWNANDFTSGVYFYKMKSGDYSSTKKMILIK